MTRRGHIDTMTEDALNTQEDSDPSAPRGRVRIRSLRPTFWRNGRQFTAGGEVFDAEELGWTDDQWKTAREDKMLVIEEKVKD